jgi:hypothetical protein
MSIKHNEVATQNPARELLSFQPPHIEALDCPSLGEIFPESAQLPPAAEPPRAETLSLHAQEALLHSLKEVLQKVELGGDAVDFDDVPSTLSKLWHCQSQYLVQAAEALANGSRNR